MNLPNKITVTRILLTLLIIFILIFPFDVAGIDIPKLFINELIVVDIKYVIAGILFIIAAISDVIDGRLARKLNQVSDFGKVTDRIADKILINVVLIILTSKGFINPIIPVVIVLRDEVVNSIRMVASVNRKRIKTKQLSKIKDYLLYAGIALTLFYNLPFELWNLKVSDFLLVLAAVLSIITGVEYFLENKKTIYQSLDSDDIEHVEI
jgi:CDP-diacylglycerol--glycerol-3-phosphate 3-phosphatidyltransferase